MTTSALPVSAVVAARKPRRKTSRIRGSYQKFVVYEGAASRVIEICGIQNCRTLGALIDAGEDGLSLPECASWARRLSHYVFILRADHNLEIDSVKPDGAADSRYILRTHVTRAPVVWFGATMPLCRVTSAA